MITILSALPSWCMTCKAITGTKWFKNGSLSQKYCTKCHNPK